MNRYRSTRAPGFSLIELLVAMAIGLILTLAITSVMIRSEGSKRATTSVNDVNQSGAYATYVLDRYIRSAGSGYSQSWGTVYGCLLNASYLASPVLPLPSAIPASSPFNKVTLEMRLAPLIIGKDLADTATETRGDVLMVMGGTAGVAESPQTVLPGSVTTSQISLPTALGYVTNDMLLLADPGVGSCMINQVSAHVYSDAGQVLPLGGDYARDPTGFGANTIALQLGRADANPPQFKLFGVGANNTLFSHDLLKPPGQAPEAISDNIVEMRAVYGVDTDADGRVDDWVDATGATYGATALTSGSADALKSLRKILAVRVGLILRTALQERSPATAASGVMDAETFAQANAASRTLFSDLPALTVTRAVTTADIGYRFRAVEATIPLRNVLMAP
jgi:type IV pilus assembly protein PilW